MSDPKELRASERPNRRRRNFVALLSSGLAMMGVSAVSTRERKSAPIKPIPQQSSAKADQLLVKAKKHMAVPIPSIVPKGFRLVNVLEGELATRCFGRKSPDQICLLHASPLYHLAKGVYVTSTTRPAHAFW